MTAPIDTAYVEIRPRLESFTGQLTTGVDAAMRTAAARIDTALTEVSAAAGRAGAAIGRDLSIGARIGLAELDAAVSGVAGAVGGELTSASEVASTAISRSSAEAGRDLGRHISEGAAVADGALRSVAATGTAAMGTVAASANAAATATESRFAGLNSKLAGFARTGALALGAGLVAVVGFGLKSAATLEQVQIQFQSLTGSIAAGNKQFTDLQKFAAVTPFEFKDLTTAAARFDAFATSVGLSQSQLIPFITTIGNVASATGGGAQALDSVSLALGQIASRGKVTLDNINQLSNAMPGFSGVAAIAAAEGITQAQAMELISTGTLNASKGIQDLLVGMQKFPGAAGAMEKQSQTLLGVFSTFKDTVSQALVGAFAPIIPTIKNALVTATPVIGDALKVLAPALGQVLAGLLPLISVGVKLLAGSLAPLLSGLAPLFPVFNQIAVVLEKALVPVMTELGPVITDLAKPLGDLLIALLPLIPPLAELVVALTPLIDLLARFVGWIVSAGIVKALTPAINGLALVLDLASVAIAEFVRWLNSINWAEVGRAIGGWFVDAWHAVTRFFTGLGDWFGRIPARTREAFDAMRLAAVERVEALVAFGRSIPGRIEAAIGNLRNLLLNAGRNLIRGLIQGVEDMVKPLTDKLSFITHLIPAWKGPVEADRRLLYPAGRNVIQGFGEGIEAGLPRLRDVLSGVSLSVPGAVAAPAAAAGVAGPIAVNVIVNFNGITPTPAQAYSTGKAAGQGIADQLEQRGVATSVRTL